MTCNNDQWWTIPRGTLPNYHRDSCIGWARYTKLETMAENGEGGDRKKGERMEREREGGRTREIAHSCTLTLMTCQSSPRIRWGLPSMMSWAPILMMLHPMELAELRASVWFSCIVNTFNLPLLMALSSTVLGTEVLISLLWGCACACKYSGSFNRKATTD